MPPASDPFIAIAANIEDTMNSYGGNAGFRVPEYQRDLRLEYRKHKTAHRGLSKWIFLSFPIQR